TVEPAEEVAAVLTGPGRSREMTAVRPGSTKSRDLTVTLPVADLQAIQPPADAVAPEDVAGTIWPHVERAVLARVLAHRSPIGRTNARTQAERLTGKLNRLHARRAAAASPPDTDPSDIDAAEPEVEDIARAHHGSMSKEVRAGIEEQ